MDVKEVASLLESERQYMIHTCPEYLRADGLSSILLISFQLAWPKLLHLSVDHRDAIKARTLCECAAAYRRGADLFDQYQAGTLPPQYPDTDPSDLLGHLDCGPDHTALDQRVRACRAALWAALPDEGLAASLLAALDQARAEVQDFLRMFSLCFGCRDRASAARDTAFYQWLKDRAEPN